MKVFFTASLRGRKLFDSYYKKIYIEIEKLGYNHLDEEILQLSDKDFYDRIEKKGQNAYIELYKRKMQHLKDADICVFESSLHSLSIGFLIEKALDQYKPTVVFYLDDNIPHFLAGISDEKLLIRKYNKDNLSEVVKKTLDEARTLGNKRINFFISPELLRYLDTTSKQLGITKSYFIRNLIVEHQKKNQGS